MLEDQISRKADAALSLAFAIVLASWALLPPARAACNAPGVTDYDLVDSVITIHDANGNDVPNNDYIPLDGKNVKFHAVVGIDQINTSAVGSVSLDYKWSGVVTAEGTVAITMPNTNADVYSEEITFATPGLKEGQIQMNGTSKVNEVCEKINDYSVNVVQFSKLKVTDDADSANTVEVSDATMLTLYVAETADGTAVVKIEPTIVNNTADYRKRVVWSVAGNSASTNGGTFETASPDISVTLTPASDNDREFTIKAGLDLNRNFEKDIAEEIQFTVKVVVLKVEIKKPEGSADDDPPKVTKFIDASYPYRYDWQGVCSSQPGFTSVHPIEGDIQPGGLTYEWTLPVSCGTLANANTATPTHTSPATVTGNSVDGELKLEAVDGTTHTGCEDKRVVRIYDDHLRRDMENFKSPPIMNTQQGWVQDGGNATISMVCHDSTTHAYKGEKGTTAFWAGWNVIATVEAPDKDYPLPDLGPLTRGDIVAYYRKSDGTLLHSQTFTGSSTWGANNKPFADNDPWKFATCPAGGMWMNHDSPLFPIVIKSFDKP